MTQYWSSLLAMANTAISPILGLSYPRTFHKIHRSHSAQGRSLQAIKQSGVDMLYVSDGFSGSFPRHDFQEQLVDHENENE